MYKMTWVNQWAYRPREHNGDHMDKWGLVYTPTSCQSDIDRCKLHIHYHGCIADRAKLRHLWSTVIELNGWAESNEIVVLYPQAGGDRRAGKGCWNWGWEARKDDPLFDTKRSIQLRTVMSLVTDLKHAIHSGTAADVRSLTS